MFIAYLHLFYFELIYNKQFTEFLIDGVDGIEEKRDKRKEGKKFLFKKDSKDKGYLTLTGHTSQESIFLVNTK